LIRSGQYPAVMKSKCERGEQKFRFIDAVTDRMVPWSKNKDVKEHLYVLK